MPQIIAFDIYGTLISTHGVLDTLAKYIGDKAQPFSEMWRDKQLEYSFRRGLMRDYKSFSTCTKESLDFVDRKLSAHLDEQQKQTLLSQYAKLPAFDDVGSTLVDLKAMGVQSYAFSNGTSEAVSGLLKNANVLPLMNGIVSVDDLKTFKPNPDVYQHLLREVGCDAGDVWLISGNCFDIIGAHGAGLRTVWLKRDSNAVFDPWGVEPSLVISSLSELVTLAKSSALFS